MSIEERADYEIAQLTMELVAMQGDLIRQFPIDDYLSDVKAYRQLKRNTYFSRKRTGVFEKLEAYHGSHALTLHHKLALASFVRDSLERLKDGNLSDEFHRLYHEWFERVLSDLHRGHDTFYDHRDRLFRLDLGVCSLRSIPVGGAWIVQISRVGFLPFLGGGTKEFINYTRFLAFRMRGFSSYCVIHTVDRYLPRFSERNMYLAYLRMADLMRRDSKIKGIYRRSWFLDPKLGEITPELAYLRSVPQENGASLFPCRNIFPDTKRALAMSVRRRKLHAEGHYSPRGYAYIWPRREFLDWADDQNASSAI